MNQEQLIDLFDHWSRLFIQNQEYLIKLDSVAGDSDIGYVLSDGFKAVSNGLMTLDENDIGKVLYSAGKILSNKAPSSMGTLLAIGFVNAGKKLKGTTELDNFGILSVFEYIADGVMATGKAAEGEKTFLDSILPAIRAGKDNAQLDTYTMALSAYHAAQIGFNNATQMIARHGRIAFRGDQSVGIQDPGAAVGVILFQGLVEVYKQ